MSSVLDKMLRSGAVTLVMDQAIVSAGNFVTTILIAKALTTSQFGGYSLLNTTFLIVTGIANALVSEPVRIFGVGVAGSQKSNYASAQMLLRIATSLPVAIVAVVASFGLARDMDFLAPSFLLVCVAAMFQELARAFAASNRRWADVVMTDAISYGVRIAGLGVMSALDSLSLPRAFLIMAAASITASAFRPLGSSAFKWPAAKVVRDCWEQNWRYGKWLAAESLVFSLSTQIYVFVVASCVGLSAVAGISAAQSVVNLMNVVLISATTSISVNARYALLTEGYGQWRALLLRSGAVVLGVAVLASVTLTVFAEPIMRMLYTKEIAQSAHLIAILSVGAVLTIGNSVLNVAFRTAEMPKVGVTAKSVSAVVTNIVAIPLVWKYDVTGAAAGIVLTQVCWLAVFLQNIFRKRTLSERNVNSTISRLAGAAQRPVH